MLSAGAQPLPSLIFHFQSLPFQHVLPCSLLYIAFCLDPSVNKSQQLSFLWTCVVFLFIVIIIFSRAEVKVFRLLGTYLSGRRSFEINHNKDQSATPITQKPKPSQKCVTPFQPSEEETCCYKILLLTPILCLIAHKWICFKGQDGAL